MKIIADIQLLIYSTLLFTPPLLFAAIGCCFLFSSGIINIGIDGLMIVGAFVGCVSTYFLQNNIMGILLAGVASGIFSLLFALFVLKFKVDSILTGFVLNIFLSAVVIIISYMFFNSTDSPPLTSNLKIPILFSELTKSDNIVVKLLSSIFSTYITTYIAFILAILSTFILYKTKIGLYIRACGINKVAAFYVGISRSKIQFLCIILCGFLCGISGAIITMAITNQFRIVSITGQGYIALAAVLFGKSNPLMVMVCCLIFGFFSGLKVIIPADSTMVNLVQIIPYMATIIFLMVLRKNSINENKNLRNP